jgi:hypothetical protein
MEKTTKKQSDINIILNRADLPLLYLAILQEHGYDSLDDVLNAENIEEFSFIEKVPHRRRLFTAILSFKYDKFDVTLSTPSFNNMNSPSSSSKDTFSSYTPLKTTVNPCNQAVDNLSNQLSNFTFTDSDFIEMSKVVKPPLSLKETRKKLNAELLTASQWGRIDDVKSAIDRGANSFNKAFSCAASGGHVSILNLLINYPVDINRAMEIACKSGNLDTLKFLELLGGKLTTEMIKLAALRHCKPIVNYISYKLGLIEKLVDEKLNSAKAYSAAQAGDLNIIKESIKICSDLSYTRIAGCAASGGHYDILNYLISSNIPFDANDTLLIAAKSGNVKSMSIILDLNPTRVVVAINHLLQRNENLDLSPLKSAFSRLVKNVSSDMSQGSLIIEASSFELEVNKLLFRDSVKACPIIIPSPKLNLPLNVDHKPNDSPKKTLNPSIDMNFSHNPIQETYIYQEEDPSITNDDSDFNNQSYNAIRLSVEKEYEDELKYVEQKKQDTIRYIKNGEFQKVRSYVNCGYVITPKMVTLAAQLGNTDILKLLLNHSAHDLEPALRNAAQSGRMECCNLLISKGARDIASAAKCALAGGHLNLSKQLLSRI